MSEKRKYDGTVARIAGNLMSGASALWMHNDDSGRQETARHAVLMARAIVAEVERTEPRGGDGKDGQ